MVVVIASKRKHQGYVTPSYLGQDVVIFEVVSEIDDYLVEGYLDLRELQDTDKVVVCEEIAVDGVNYSAYACLEFAGKQDNPVVRFHTKTLLSTMKYRVRLYQPEGYLRTFYYGFIVEVMGTA